VEVPSCLVAPPAAALRFAVQPHALLSPVHHPTHFPAPRWPVSQPIGTTTTPNCAPNPQNAAQVGVSAAVQAGPAALLPVVDVAACRVGGVTEDAVGEVDVEDVDAENLSRTYRSNDKENQNHHLSSDNLHQSLQVRVESRL